VPAGRQRSAAIEDADDLQTEKTVLEHVVPGQVLAVHPPGEVQQEPVEAALDPLDIAGAAGLRTLEPFSPFHPSWTACP
jgi:hypothetical protein